MIPLIDATIIIIIMIIFIIVITVVYHKTLESDELFVVDYEGSSPNIARPPLRGECYQLGSSQTSQTRLNSWPSLSETVIFEFVHYY